MSDKKVIPMQPDVTQQAERMRIAAEYRFEHPEATWDEIAEHTGVTRVTTWRWRSTEQWEIVSRDVALAHVGDLAPDALAALRKAWKRGNPAGALDVLRALALLRNSEVNVTHRMGDEIDREIMELIAAARADQPS